MRTMKKSLLIILILLASCKEEKQIDLRKSREIVKVKKKDSLSISITIPAKSSTGLNVWIKPYDEFHLKFKNKSEKDSVIVKKLPLFYDNYIMSYKVLWYVKNKDFIVINKYFRANQNYSDIELKLDSNIIKYKKEILQNIITDSIYNCYRRLGIKLFKNKELNTSLIEKELDSLNSFFKNIITNQRFNSQINEMLYLGLIQKINPKDKKIEDFLENSKEIITGSVQSGLLFNYFKNNSKTLNYHELNKNNYSNTYIELLAIGAYRFLKSEDNKGDTRHKKTVDWLRTTDFYKKDSIHIKKQITPLNHEKFKNHLSKLAILDLNSNQTTISEIIKQNQAQYYLIDFWATWCAPCISGVKTMNGMTIPKNVKIISLSVDKEKDKDKWMSKAKELNQKFTYWFNERLEENIEFTQFIEMQSIPRYVLIDKNMNLIDQAFYHPQELQFLSKLNDLKNHKYW